MSASTLLTALYPPPVRERWGAEIQAAVRAGGARSWADTVAGAVRLWLHPTDWPETVAGQTRRTLLVALAAVTAVTALVLRFIQPSTTITADPGRPVTSLWLVPLLAGVAIAVPVRPLLSAAVGRLAGDAVRILAAPAAAIVALLLLAHSGLVPEHPTGPARLLLLTYYWGTLAFTALRACVLATRVIRSVPVPSTRRLRVSALLIGTGMGLGASQGLLSIVRGGMGAGSIAALLAMAILAVATIRAGHDLRRG